MESERKYFNTSDVYTVANVDVKEEDGKGSIAGLYVVGSLGDSHVRNLPNKLTRIYIRTDPEVIDFNKEYDK